MNEKNNLSLSKFKDLIVEREIREYSICDTKYSLPLGGLIVELPDGEKGIAVTIIQPHYFVEDNIKKTGETKKLKILRLDGSEYMDLSEPELITNLSSAAKIARDDKFLYVTTYNTRDSYLAKYEMQSFKREWKKQFGFTAMQSITVDSNNIICFNMTNGSIDYFNKKNGEKIKSIDIKEQFGHSHHNLASAELMLLAGSPGSDWLTDLPNQLKVFNNNGILENSADIPNSVGKLNAISIDMNLEIAYVAFDNKIISFDSNGYVGMMTMPCGRVLELNVDNETGSLIVSSSNMESNTGGKVNILSPEAIKKLLITNTFEKLDDSSLRR